MVTRQRWFWIFVASMVLASLFIGGTVPALAAEKSIVWDRFDVDLTVNTDGTFDVAEHQGIRFVDGTFTFGYRNIPKQNFSDITDWSVTDASGNTYQQTAYANGEPYTFTVDDQGDAYVIKWYFPETSTPETYTLGYRVHDGLRYYEGGDQVWWKAVYADRQFPVLNSRVRVLLPAPAVMQNMEAYINSYPAGDAVTMQPMDDNRVAMFDVNKVLSAGEELEVRVQFTPGVVIGAAPYWQAAADSQAAALEAEAARRAQLEPLLTVILGALGLLFFLGGPLLIYLVWYRKGRDKPVARVADYLPEPPDTLSPGLAGVLLDDTADMQDIVATIVDLARRKAISITEVREEGFFRSGTDFIYRREHKDVSLEKFEKELLDGLFGHKDEVRLSDLKNKFYKHISGIKDEMYDALIAREYYKERPDAVRSQFGCLGTGLIFLSVGLGIALLMFVVDYTAAAFCPPIGLFVTALALVIGARYMPRKTDQGAEVAARWNAFKEYLQHMEKYTDVAEQKEIWDRWLPYAIAFGVDKEYIRKFEQVDAPAPGWYIPSPTLYGPYHRRYYGPGSAGGGMSGADLGDIGGSGGGGGLGGGLSDASRGLGSSLSGMSAGLGAMLSGAASTFSSQPSSSGSHSGGGFSGGGFSGGGSFGGGGGGGGGGGFG